MSVVSLAKDGTSQVTLEILKKVAAKNNIVLPTEEDEQAYLILLQSGDSLIKQIDNSPDYIHPGLKPVAVTSGERTYWKPGPDTNPLNGWSHRCEFVAEKPTSALLKGRTIAFKDNVSVAGLPTTIGTFAELLSKDAAYPISPIDATVVTRVLNAGGLVKGTATCENYSACPLSYSPASGPVHNPWMRGYNAGGSSSGSGVLVATNLAKGEFGDTVEMAIGGDQGGSIRLPASYNGIYGMKPTHGLIPYSGVAPLVPMIDHVGPMAYKLADVALLLKVLAGYDGIDTRMSPESPLLENVKDYPAILESFLTKELPAGVKRGSSFKVGLLKEGFEIPALSDEVRTTVSESARKFFTAAGAEVVDISVPMHADGAAIWTASTRASMADWALTGKIPGYLTHASPHLNPQWPPDQKMYELLSETNPALVNIIFASTYLKEQYGPQAEAKAHRKVFELRAAYDAALQEVDVLITPTTPTIAMPHPKMKSVDGEGSTVMEKMKLAIGSSVNTCPFNATGHPAMNVPCGFGVPEGGAPTDKLPIGMQVIAKRWDEVAILKAAALFETGQSIM